MRIELLEKRVSRTLVLIFEDADWVFGGIFSGEKEEENVERNTHCVRAGDEQEELWI